MYNFNVRLQFFFEQGDGENVYECVNGNSSPECDLASGEPSATDRSSGHNSSDFQRFSTFLRPASVSIPYCGSETESDIYSPYSFYGSEEVSFEIRTIFQHEIFYSPLRETKAFTFQLTSSELSVFKMCGFGLLKMAQFKVYGV